MYKVVISIDYNIKLRLRDSQILFFLLNCFGDLMIFLRLSSVTISKQIKEFSDIKW